MCFVSTACSVQMFDVDVTGWKCTMLVELVVKFMLAIIAFLPD